MNEKLRNYFKCIYNLPHWDDGGKLCWYPDGKPVAESTNVIKCARCSRCEAKGVMTDHYVRPALVVRI